MIEEIAMWHSAAKNSNCVPKERRFTKEIDFIESMIKPME